ncbi:hypothetical protein Tco_0199946 [Tanacetum coccineum]
MSSLFPHLQQLTPIPTPTTTEATTSTTAVPDFETLSAFQQRITDLEKDVKELKTIDHSAALLSTIKSKVSNAIKEYLGTSLNDALYKVLKKHDVDIIKEHSVLTEIIKRLRQQYVPKKSTEDIIKIKMKHARKQQSFNRSPKQRALYNALMESILEDEDAMDEGVTDKLKKMKQDDADKDKGPSAGSDRGLKRQKTRKDTEPSKKAKSTESSKGTSKSQPKSTNKSTQSKETAALKYDWFKKPERPPSPDSNWNVRKSVKFRPPQMWINKIAQAKKPLLSFDELMSTLIDFSAYVMNHLKIDNLTQEHLNNPEGKEYPFDLSKLLPLIMKQGRQVVLVDYFINNDLEYLRGGSSSKKYMTSTTKTKAAKYDIPGIKDMVPSLWSLAKKLSNLERDVIFDLGVALWMFTRRIVILMRVEDLQLGVESYQKKLNITIPDTFRSDISKRIPYTAYNNPQEIIYEDKYKRNRLMRIDELYKFIDGMLTSVRTVLHDIASNLRMDYLPKRRWSNLDRYRSRIMIKAIDKLLLERMLMRSLEKFVGGRDYGEDLRLLERTI